MTRNSGGISRRNFVTGAVLSGAAVAAASVFGCSPAAKQQPEEETTTQRDASTEADPWLGTEPATPEAFDEEITADVVILGAGIAGVSACRSAIEEGATVAIFEKSADVAGRSQDFVALGSSWIEENFPSLHKMSDIKWSFLQDTIKGNLGRTKEAIWSRWADECGPGFDWWIGAFPADELSSGNEGNDNTAGGEKNCVTLKTWPLPSTYDPSSELYPSYAGTAVLMGADGSRSLAFTRANFELAQSEGAERLTSRFEARAEKLLTDGSGRVTGAVIRYEDGSVCKATATKGVVLSTGDFLNNPDMLEHFCPRTARGGYTPEKSIYTTFDATGAACNTGDGHRMAMWVGANMQLDGCSMTHMEKQEVEAIGTDPCLWLNLEGKRFMNEDCQACHMSQRLEELPGNKIFQVFDGNILDELDCMPYGHHRVTRQTQEGLDAAVEAGALLRGDTIDELLAQMEGIDVQAAKASIERYNELCAKGVDEDFGKTPMRLFPVDTAPFYCVTWGGNVSLVTLSGLESDEECHVYSAEHKIIPGLYVAGNTQGNRWAIEYAETALGMSHSMAMVYGRIAGKNALNQI